MKNLFIILLVNIFSYGLNAQTGILKGKITDAINHSPVEGVNIYNQNKKYFSTSDSSGYFIIKNIPYGDYAFSFTHIGYKSRDMEIVIDDSVHSAPVRLEPFYINLAEVTVISTRSPKSIKEIPYPVEIANENMIEERSPVSASDLLNNFPGITIQRDGIWSASVKIRGLGNSNFVTLIDGSRIETATDLAGSLSLIDLNNIDRIEVIKGPASSIYGTGAPGGVINFIPKSPGFSEEFNFTGAFSSGYKTVNEGVQQNLGLNLRNSTWNLRLNGTIRNASNTETPSGILDNSSYSDKSYSALLNISPFTNHEINLNYQDYKADDVGIPGGYPLFPDIADVKYTEISRDLFSLEYKIKNISNIFNRISFKYYNQNIYRFVENIPYVTASNPSGRTYVRKVTPNARHYTNGILVQTNMHPLKDHILVAGIDAWQRKIDSRRERHLQIEMIDSTGTVTSMTNRIIGEKPLPNANFTSIGLFIQDEINIYEKFDLNLGGRVDHISVHNDEVLNPVYIINNGIKNSSPPNQSLYWKSYNENDLSWSSNIGVIYSAAEKTDITLNLAHSFRSPSLEERYQYIDLGSLIRIGNPDLKPERGYFADLGLRLWEDNFTLRWNIYLNYLNNLVAEVPGEFDERPALIKTNIGKARIQGSEISFELQTGSWFLLYSNFSYIYGRDVVNDNYLPQLPPVNGKLGIKLNLNGFSFDVSSTFYGVQNHLAEGEISTPGYNYFDLFLQTPSCRVNFLNFKFYGGIENITNKSYRNHLSTNRGSIKEEPARNFFLKLNVEW